jgi:cellulose synthase/poly-beta-1,6-N-acetylglucosamine synthase-like glycosyltransferase
MMLWLAALVLTFVHITVPLGYYGFLRIVRGIPITKNQTYTPYVTVVIPTYNEGRLISDKLANLAQQEYPLDKVDVLVVDSGSTDGTVDVATKWKETDTCLRLHIIQEPQRKGKAEALNTALQHAPHDMMVISDADSLWAADALRKALAYFSDARVGALTGTKEPIRRRGVDLEIEYRNFYNRVRILESKIYSTPIFNGELAAFRKHLLESLGGFPVSIGADDSHMATTIALEGHRAVAVGDVKVYERIPQSLGAFGAWRVRRAKHLVQHFSTSITKITKAPSQFRIVLATEAFLHLVNPWLLILALPLVLTAIALGELPLWAWVALALLGVSLVFRRVRQPSLVWVANQLILCYAALSGIRSRELVWKKIS